MAGVKGSTFVFNPICYSYPELSDQNSFTYSNIVLPKKSLLALYNDHFWNCVLIKVWTKF